MANLDSMLKSRDITLPAKVHLVKAMVFPVVMYGCERAECWRTDAFELCVGEDSWESLGHKGDQTSQSWGKSALNMHWKDWCWIWSCNTLATWCEEQLIRKDPDAGKDWRQEKGMTEDEMVGWYHWLNGYEFEQAPGDDEGQGSLACCSPQGRKESGHDWTFWTGLHPTRLLCPWDFPGKNTGVGCHFTLQGIFTAQGLNQHLLHWEADSLSLSHQGSPIVE